MRSGIRGAAGLIMAIVAAGAAGAEPPAPAKGPFHLKSDEFPVGMFSADHPGAMAQVAAMGIGFVHTYANGRSSDPEGIAKDRAYLDAARKEGLRVLFNLNGRRLVAHEDGVAEMLTIVDAVKDHPALGMWYLYDEPDGKHTPDQLKPFYLALKEKTPNIPIVVASAWSKGWYNYQDVLDILMIDNYPVQHQPFPGSKLDHMTKFTDSALRLGKPVIPINQCFNWKALAGEAETYRGSPTAQLRYPTRAELRYWSYTGLAQGVRGMFWWSYYRSVQTGTAWIKNEFAPVTREFAEFTKLVAPAHQPLILSRARDDDLLMALWERPAGTYLVAVNSWPLARPLARWMEERLENAALTPWGSTRPVEARVENGKLIVAEAEPWEAFVWKVEPKKPGG